MLPTVLTIILLIECYQFVQENIGVHITEGAVRLFVLIDTKYPELTGEELSKYQKENELDSVNVNDRKQRDQMRLWKLRRTWTQGYGSLVGFFLAIIIVYVVGRLLASFIGHRLWKYFEIMVNQVPGFKQVYPYVKQITEYFLGEKKLEFNRVVLVQYPRKGVWSIGLVTGAGLMKTMAPQKETASVAVFIPSSPTPFTGYVIHVEQSELIDLPITIEEALRFTISGGVINPEKFASEAATENVKKELEENTGNLIKEIPNDN